MKDENQNQSSGDNSMLVQGKTISVYQGMSLEQMDEVRRYIDKKVMETFKAEFLTGFDEAAETSFQAAQSLLDKFLGKLALDAPENLSSMKTVTMQSAIFNAQKAAALRDDDDLSDTLVDILLDKSGTTPQSFKGLVLSEAIEVASKLTTDQINLITAIVMLKRTLDFSWVTPDLIFGNLQNLVGPFLGRLPNKGSTVQYLTYTGVGSALFPNDIFDVIAKSYAPAFSDGFAIEQIPPSLHSLLDKARDLFEKIDGSDPIKWRLNLGTAQSLDKQLNLENPVIQECFGDLKTFAEATSIAGAEARARAEAGGYTDLIAVIDNLTSVNAHSLELSAVGIAIGQANWRRVHPSSAPALDMYLDG